MESYDEILQRMRESYKSKTGAKPTEESDTSMKLRVIAAEIFSAKANIEWLKRQMFVQTADGEYLDYHASLRGLERKQGTKAKGNVVFYIDLPVATAVKIPKGTIVCTFGDFSVRFITTEAAEILPEETETSAPVPCEALEIGENGNIGAGEITLMVTPPVGVTGVKNTSVFLGGSNYESDDELRQRIIYSYRYIQNGTNAAYYKNIAGTVESVYSTGLISGGRGPGTLDVYVSGKGVKASDETVAAVEELLEKEREINIDLKVFAAVEEEIGFRANVTVKPGYYFSSVYINCVKQIEEYINSLGVGNNFYISKAADIIYHTEGVENYTINTMYGGDVVVLPSKFAKAGTINITEN